MAPEQASGRGVGPAADVYSLGVTNEMITGRPPLQAPRRSIRRRCCQEPAPLLRLQPKLPRATWKPSASNACTRSRVRRYSGRGRLWPRDLGRFLCRASRSRRVRWARIERGLRWCRRQPAVAAPWAMLALVLVGTTLAVFWYQEQRSARAADARWARPNRDGRRAGRAGHGGRFAAARQARAVLHAELARPGGGRVFQLLNDPARWRWLIDASQAALDRARLFTPVRKTSLTPDGCTRWRATPN